MEARWERSPMENKDQRVLLRFGSRWNGSYSPKSLKMFISTGFRAEKDSKTVTRCNRGCTCLLTSICAPPGYRRCETCIHVLIFPPIQRLVKVVPLITVL